MGPETVSLRLRASWDPFGGYCFSDRATPSWAEVSVAVRCCDMIVLIVNFFSVTSIYLSSGSDWKRIRNFEWI